MNKRGVLLVIVVLIISCSSAIKKTKYENELRIVRIDSITDYYVFNTIDFRGNNSIILGDKEKIANCKPFGRVIIKDSIRETSFIRDGKGFMGVGTRELTIDGIKVKEEGKLTNTIVNCNAFR